MGKSLVTSLLAVNMQRKGYQTAILDADLTGPSIPRAFGITQKADASELGIFPVKTKTGIQLMSINLLLAKDSDPVVWRGPILSSMVKQFWTDVYWHDVDYMFIDMPPGTGDVPLTVFQSLPIDGVIVVTSPQELVSMIVKKAVRMADMMKIPVLGIVENMSYFDCDRCGKRHHIFGQSDIEKLAKEYNIPATAQIPINNKLALASDRGMIELYDGDWLDKLIERIEKL
ncbi:MAG: P-loop NTPase [Christensenellales bacterium]